MKKIIKSIILITLLVVSLFVFTGCNKYESDYTKDEATKMMKQYIKEKYGETPEFEYVKAYSDVALNEILSLGYYAKTKDGYYVRLTDFKGEAETDIRDTKQFEEIEEGIERYIENNNISDSYKVSIELEDEKNESSLWKSLWSGYPKNAKYDGTDIAEFFKNNESISETHYTNDIDGGVLKVNIAFFTTNDIKIDALNDYTKNLSTKLSCKVTSAISNEIKNDKISAIIFTSTSNPFISKMISNYNGSYHSEKNSNESLKVNDNININSELGEDGLDTSKWSIKTKELDKIEDSNGKYEILSKGYKLSTSDEGYYDNIYISMDISDIIKNNSKENLILISCSKDDNGWYIKSSEEINNAVHKSKSFISNDRLIFRTTDYSSISDTYFFVAKKVK